MKRKQPWHAAEAAKRQARAEDPLWQKRDVTAPARARRVQRLSRLSRLQTVMMFFTRGPKQ